MMSSLYFLAFAFLTSTSLLFLLWHCRIARARQLERRRLELQDAGSAAADAAFLSSFDLGLTYVARGAPAFVIRALPTHIFGGGGGGGGGQDGSGHGAGGGAKAAASGDPTPDIEMGLGADQDEQRQQHHQQQHQHQQQRGSTAGQASQEGTAAVPAAAAAGEEAARAVGAGAGAGAGSFGPEGTAAAAAGLEGAPPADADECTICLCAYERGDVVKQLPCRHSYHAQCIDCWLRKSAVCPLCKHTLWDPVPVAVLPLYLELMALRRQQDDVRLAIAPFGGAGAAAAAELLGLYPSAAGAPSPAVAGGSPAAGGARAPRGRGGGAGGSGGEAPVAWEDGRAAGPAWGALTSDEARRDARPQEPEAGSRREQGSQSHQPAPLTPPLTSRAGPHEREDGGR